MNWAFEYVVDKKYIRVVSEGIFTAREQAHLIEDLISQPYWRKGMPVLFDNRKLDYSVGGTTAIKEASRFHIENNERIGGGKAALLMKSATDFGFGRQYELLTDVVTSVNIHVFLDENQALRWLLS
jgi:hypothetical protein